MGLFGAFIGAVVVLSLLINLVASIYRVVVAQVDEYHDVPQRVQAEQTLAIWLAFAVLCVATWAAWG